MPHLPPSRRDLLRVGALTLGGASLADTLRLRAADNPKSNDTSVLLLFVHGGPSHLETYDMKPAAPDEIRGPYRPIRTAVPGLDVCEHLPKHAKIAKKFTLIRSCAHDEADHFAGHRRFLSGYGKLKSGFSYEPHYPMMGAVVGRMHPGKTPGLPGALNVGGVVVNGPDYAPACSEGFWSGVHRVPIVNGGLKDADLRVSSSLLGDRLKLRDRFNSLRRELDARDSMDVIDGAERQALEVLTSGKVQRAFDVSREDPRTRERYGDGYGREVLVARRLVEAGVRFVTVRIPGSAPGTKAYDWDDHAVNWDMNTAMKARLPMYDHVVSTLIDDLYNRGLDKNVLLIVTGEFGRTPRLENKDGRIGRDHWPGAMSILVAGGGIETGRVIGSTNAFGEHPKERAMDPHDVLATVYKYVGIDHTQNIVDPTGRPIPLCRGEPIRELLG